MLASPHRTSVSEDTNQFELAVHRLIEELKKQLLDEHVRALAVSRSENRPSRSVSLPPANEAHVSLHVPGDYVGTSVEPPQSANSPTSASHCNLLDYLERKQCRTLSLGIQGRSAAAPVAATVAAAVASTSRRPSRGFSLGASRVIDGAENADASPRSFGSLSPRRRSSEGLISQKRGVIFEQHEVHSVWKNVRTKPRGHQVRRGLYNRDSPVSVKSVLPVDVVPAATEKSSLSGMLFAPLAPNCNFRVVWDILAMLVLIHDSFVIPLSLVDLPLVNDRLGIMSWTTRLYWTVDVLVSLRSSYYLPNGDVVSDFTKIATRYMSKWMLPDLLLLTLDYTLEMMRLSETNMGSYGRLTRSLRILRLLRLVRVIRAPKLLRRLLDAIRSEKVILFLSIAKSMACILSIIHLLACMWYGLGTLDNGWVERSDMFDIRPSVRYTTAFLWSLSQFTGSTDLYPSTLVERSFGIFAQTFAFIAATVFVSDLTSSMTRLHIISGRQSTQLSVLRKYMTDQQISHRLMHRIVMNASYMLAERRKTMPEHEIELLSLVSQPLIEELRYECYSSTFTTHPLFNAIFSDNPVVARKLCSMAVSVVSFCEGDLLFSPGEVPLTNRLYFVLRGELTYALPEVKPMDVDQEDVCSQDSDQEEFGEERTVVPAEWLCEATLWCQWIYKGWLLAKDAVQLMLVGGDDFERILSRSYVVGIEISKYVAAYVQRLNEGTVVTELGSDIDSDGFVNLALRKRKLRRAYANILVDDDDDDGGKATIADEVCQPNPCDQPSCRRSSLRSSCRASFFSATKNSVIAPAERKDKEFSSVATVPIEGG